MRNDDEAKTPASTRVEKTREIPLTRRPRPCVQPSSTGKAGLRHALCIALRLQGSG